MPLAILVISELTFSVPSKKIVHWANVCWSAHATAQIMQTHNQWSISSV